MRVGSHMTSAGACFRDCSVAAARTKHNVTAERPDHPGTHTCTCPSLNTFHKATCCTWYQTLAKTFAAKFICSHRVPESLPEHEQLARRNTLEGTCLISCAPVHCKNTDGIRAERLHIAAEHILKYCFNSTSSIRQC